jgi:hypothetical protein
MPEPAEPGVGAALVKLEGTGVDCGCLLETPFGVREAGGTVATGLGWEAGRGLDDRVAPPETAAGGPKLPQTLLLRC